MNRPTQVIFLLQALFKFTNGGSREYHYFPQLKAWSEAQRYCQENHIDLAIIETEEEWSKVQIILQNAALDAWIGLYDDYTSWRWSLNGTYFYQDSNTPFSDWWTLSFDNWHSIEHCGEIYYGYLNDVVCSQLNYPVCYNRELPSTIVKFVEYVSTYYNTVFTESTNSYFVISTTMNWTEAQSYCRLHYTDLTSVRNKQEKDAIFNLTQYSLRYWVGLSRENWKWSDQSTFLWKKWALNEHLNLLSYEFCASAGLGGFIDGNCAQKKPFLCAVPVRTLFKVEFETDPIILDDQELDSILQNMEGQIKQNLTLHWREQANGKRFRT